MKKELLNLPLKFKLLILLVGVTTTVLALYLWLVIDLFKADKRAYVLDQSLSGARAIASATYFEMDKIKKFLFLNLKNLNQDSPDLALLSGLVKNYPEIKRVFVFTQAIKQGPWIPHLSFSSSKLKANSLNWPELKQLNLNSEYDSRLLKSKEGLALLYRPQILLENGQIKGRKNFLFFVELNEADIFLDLKSPRSERVFLIDEELQIISSSLENESLKQNQDAYLHVFKKLLSNEQAYQGAKEIHMDKGEAVLVGFSFLGTSPLKIISVLDAEKAYLGVKYLVSKSFLFFIVLFGVSIMISLLASNGLTASLVELEEASQKIAKGDFNIKLNLDSRDDEIGRLTSRFGFMAEKIVELLRESAEKAKLESDLKTARTVQETLFAEENAVLGNLQLYGYYQPASQVGGDWWYYHQMGDEVYLWIGDATGHGVSSALLTSAARATATFIQEIKDIEPVEVMRILNKVLFDVAKAKVQMTFFLARLNIKTGRMLYVNASHEPPLILPRFSPKGEVGQSIRVKDLIPLTEARTYHLGKYEKLDIKQEEIQLSAGTRLIFYTDGVFELKNTVGKKIGESGFLRLLIKAQTESISFLDFYEKLKDQVKNLATDEETDDVAFLLVEMN